jgi:UrcA family protein
MYFERKHTIAIIARGLAFISALALSPSVAEGARHLVHGPQLTVRYDDLKISERAGARSLLFRMTQAAAQVCGGAPDIMDQMKERVFKDCMRDTMDRAVASLGEPSVAELYGLPRATRVASR